jgi:hypothetical protein
MLGVTSSVIEPVELFTQGQPRNTRNGRVLGRAVTLLAVCQVSPPPCLPSVCTGYLLTLPFTLEHSNGVTHIVNVRGWIVDTDAAQCLEGSNPMHVCMCMFTLNMNRLAL